MLKPPTISICIPTYNRSAYLPEAINSILSQVEEEMEDLVEICISDNNSTDSTETVIKSIAANSKVSIRYSRNHKNLGADQNFINVVKMASGKYCLFLGSDDAIVDGCIKTTLSETESGDGVYLFNRLECDERLRIVGYTNILKSGVGSGVYRFKIEKEFIDYCQNAENIGALFSYISCICFRRELWNKVNVERWLIGTAYVHVFILLKMCMDGASLKYVKSFLVKNRCGNDSFQGSGLIGRARRILLDISGYRQIADSLLQGKTESHQKILKLVRKERPVLKSVLVIRAAADPQQWDGWSNELIRAGYSKTVIKVVGFSKWFACLAVIIHIFYKRLKSGTDWD
jgi:abequosyltransferase